MNVDQFLAAHGISLQDVLDAADTVLQLAPDDVLFMSGSLVEGIGNSSSDLDLFLLTSRQDVEYTACLTDVALVVHGCLVDVRVLQHDVVQSLVTRFEEWARQPRVPRRSFEFVLDERKLLYRLKTATPLHNETQFRALQERIGTPELLRHKLDWARHLAGTLQVDLVGLRADGDHASMLTSAQEVLGHATDALLAGYGVTNPDAKWRVRYLSRLPLDWERHLLGRVSGASAVSRFLSLNRLPETVTPASSGAYVQRVVAYSRAVFAWAERALLAGDAGTGLPRAFVSNSERRARPLPALDLDVDIRFLDDHFEVFRLNSDGVSFRLSDQAAAALCLFDGETTADELAVEESVYADLSTLLEAAGLEAEVPVDQDKLALALGRRHRRTTTSS